MKRLTLRTAAFTLAFLILCGCSNIQNYDDYFRDNDSLLVTYGNGMDDSGWVIGDEFHNFSSAQEALVADSVIPSLDKFGDPYIWAKYDEAHQVVVVSIEWWKEDTGPMNLYVWPQQPEQDDPYYAYPENQVTTTKTRGCEIIGSGLPEGKKRLNFTLKDGTCCQISAPAGITTSEMGEVLDFLLENGFDFSPFAYDMGQPMMS
jgi:hypothetical protein